MKLHAAARWIALVLLLTLLPLSVCAEAPTATVRVGWVLHPGLQEVADGVYAGYTYDYLTEVARYTGWAYEFVQGDLAGCLAALEAGEIDIVGGLLYSEERAQRFDFPQNEYGRTYKSLFAAQESSLAAYDFNAFDGMRVGMVANAAVNHEAFALFAEENGFAYTPVMYTDASSLMAAVHDGEVDAGMLGAYQATDDIRILAEFSPSPLYFAVTRGNSEALVGLNRAINRIQIDSPYLGNELYHKHFGAADSLKLTDAELAFVQASQEQPVALGIIPSDAPVTYWDEQKGKYVGISMELLDLVSQHTGLRFEYIPLDLTRSAPIGYLKDGSLPAVAGMLRTHNFATDQELILSDTLDTDTLAVVGRLGHDYTKDPASKTIAVMMGFQVSMEFVKEYFPEHRVIALRTVDECLEAVVSGRADAAVHIESCIKHLLQNPHYETLECSNTFTKDVEACIVARAEGNGLLMSVLNKGIAMITEKERTDVIINFTTMNPYHFTVNDTLYKYRLPLMAIAVLAAAVIASLVAIIILRRKNEVKARDALRLSESANETMNEALKLAEEASAAKGSFMSRMSHEIRTPLNAIIGYNTIANSDITEAKTDAECRQAMMKVADCLHKSDIASRHLLTIINDVLDMSAIESGKLQIAHERFDFKGLIQSLTALFYTQAQGKNVEFEVMPDASLEEWYVGDQMRVNQILTNLLSNAVKFTPGGGRVRLSVRQPETDGNIARVCFEVTDTGIGMTSEYLEHIWTPFEQADASIARRYGGSGLGLSITKNLTDLMHGDIEVESQPGKGSTFRVTLPLERTEQPVSTDTYRFAQVNALVVDDDAGTCDYISLLMNRLGARCVAVTSGFEAVDAVAAAREGEPFTVCLVDWRMPKMDGLETIRRIRSIVGEGLPIIVITAYDFSEILDKAAEVGVTRFISKPLFQSSLFDLLSNLCGVRPEKKTSKLVPVQFAGEQVMLVEDNAMNMEIARRILESAGLSVTCAWNGQEAVNLFEASETGAYKAILMDVQMPVMDGHQATRTIRASAHPDAESVPILAMTADAFAENVAEAMQSGMNGHISKPIHIPTLFELLSAYIPRTK